MLGTVNFSEYNVIEKERADKEGKTGGYDGGFMKLENPLGLDVEVFLGALGMPGLTAYSGIKEFGKIKKGDVVFVSAASGMSRMFALARMTLETDAKTFRCCRTACRTAVEERRRYSHRKCWKPR